MGSLLKRWHVVSGLSDSLISVCVSGHVFLLLEAILPYELSELRSALMEYATCRFFQSSGLV